MLTSIGNIHAQKNFSFQNINNKNGLSQNSVFAISQDIDGFLWFGTRDGLNRYDGYNFKTYRNNDSSNSLSGNDVRTLFLDTLTKDFWVGSISGLSKYSKESDNFQNYIHSESDTFSITAGTVWTIFRDSKKRLWIGTEQGLDLFNTDKNKFIHINLSSNNKPVDVRSIVEDAEGNLFFGTSFGLFKLENNQNYSEVSNVNESFGNDHLPDYFIKSLLIDKENNFWIGTNKGGLVFWDRKLKKIKVFQKDKQNANSLSDNNIRFLYFDLDDRLWIGTFDGLNLYDPVLKNFTIFKKNDPSNSGITDSSIRSIYADKKGNLWVGTYYGGILHLDENFNRFTNFNHTLYGNSISADVVSSFAEDEFGNLWIGTEGGGLNFFDVQKNEFKSFKPEEGKNSLSGNNVKKVLLDDGKLWVGTFNRGLNLMDVTKEKFTKFENEPGNSNSLSSNNVYGLSKEKDLLWILTYGGGLDIFDTSNQIIHHFQNNPNNPKSISSNLTRVFLKSKKGTIWIGTEKGLNKVILDQNDFPKEFEVILAVKKIYALQEDHNNNIWIGTISEGLFEFNPKSQEFKQYTTKDGLSGNTIFGIIEDNNHQLWISTNSGLSKFSPSEKIFTNYNYANGLINSEYNFNAYYKTKSGDLLFGGINGFTRFDPSTIKPNTFIPPIVFTELKQNNRLIEINDETAYLKQAINCTSKIEFKYNEANFTLQFAALDYSNPENATYSIKMEGFDRDWKNIVGKPEVSYTIQKEGNYVLRLKGGNSDGLWNPEERNIEIVVLPPPWRTWWAYLIYSILLLSSIIGLYRYVKLRHTLQIQAIAKLQQDQLHEMKLRFFTNITHEFRTPLTLILGPLKELIKKNNQPAEVADKLSLIESNANRLLNLVNQVLTFRKLASENEPMLISRNNIVDFLNTIFLHFKELAIQQNIEYNFKYSKSEIIAYYDQEKLEKVFYNLIANAFKFTPRDGKIEVCIGEDDKNISIQVSDSGIGISPELHEQIFKRFYEKSNPQTSTIKGSGIGLSISKAMVELHQGNIWVKSEIDKGTLFTVSLKKGKDHFKNNEIFKEDQTKKPFLLDPKKDYQSLGILDPEQINLNSDKNIAKQKLAKILIVEDNDEVRNYIKSIFIKEYEILTCENGLLGFQMAQDHEPDIILSDLMMPVIDGIEFCKKIKSTFETSHIPFILITAKSLVDDKLLGLNSGANDYITKPFHPDELLLKVRNILNQKKLLLHSIYESREFNPSIVQFTSADEKFLKDLIELVEKNISNPDFKIEQFAYELAVSRALLFTKIKAITDMTPKNFIKSFRLKRSIQLLEMDQLNISEIAFMVGFKEPRYFSKVFQKEYGKTPSEYISNLQIEDKN